MSLDPSRHAEISDAEREARIALAACYRLAAHYRMTDLIYTHITARVPGEEGHFLINPYGWRWEEITASLLVKIDVDGRKVDDSPEGVNPAGFTIHSAIHRANHGAAWVMHTHTRAGITVATQARGLETRLNQISLQFHERVSYHDYEGIALDLDERERIVASLGNHSALVLRNHGLLTTGASAAEMFNNMFYLERACELQGAAQGTGEPLSLVPEEVARHVARHYDQTIHEEGDLALEWAAHLRTLDSLDPSYRN
ncbi:Decarboxylase NovR [Halomonas sp. THAF12]|uniref:class II aldolase/adducin family protein n=1 Tax=Halomonas sp. THAF12 TaxID=2587849 RepID=UPI0012A8059A|nr:class II aldolase/adducin family protein [Halomonas sp. THAF12]QFT85208.1 Decarboxylase NovR [Halomonas sp. THAF12]